MVAKEILSVQHPLVKRALLLRRERKAREEEQRVLVVGKKLIADLASHLSFEIFFYHGTPPPFVAQEEIRLSYPVLKKITGLEEPDGWAAVVPLPPPQPLGDRHRILILDQIGDPGNLGALWRTALGLGWEGIWMTPGTVDPFNDKALRAAKGASFRIGYEWMEPEQICKWNGSLYLADLEGEPLDQVEIRRPFALILSNEARGPNSWTNSCVKVTIAMKNSVESLNVASAGSIFLYALRLQ